MAGTVAVVFEGGSPQDALEATLAGVRQQITLDSLDKLVSVPGIDRIVLVTNYAALGREAAALGVTVEASGGAAPFHFGRELARVTEKYRAEKVLCFSGGSVPLMPPEELAAVVAELDSRPAVVIANNSQSADLIAFSPAQALGRIDLPAIDNPLAWLLCEQAGLPGSFLPPSAGCSFDVDTPGDLLFLALHPGIGPRAAQAVAALGWDSGRLAAAVRRLGETNAEIFLAGRVGPAVVSHLNQHFRCRLRVVSEERGMKSLGRQERGEVRSLLASYLRRTPPSEFFAELAEYCSAAFIDTRVIFAALRGEVPAWDRFNSDLGRYRQIGDAFVRAFTEAAVRAPLPVVLGGHTAVAGGLWVAADRLLRSGRGGIG